MTVNSYKHASFLIIVTNEDVLKKTNMRDCLSQKTQSGRKSHMLATF